MIKAIEKIKTDEELKEENPKSESVETLLSATIELLTKIQEHLGISVSEEVEEKEVEEKEVEEKEVEKVEEKEEEIE